MKIEFTIDKIDLGKIRSGVINGDIIESDLEKEKYSRHPKHRKNWKNDHFDD